VWWHADAQDLGRAEDRLSFFYVERAHVDREQNAVTVKRGAETVHVPAAMLSVLLFGPGTTVTHAAITLLADSGTSVCWVGEHGVRLYAHGLGPARHSRLLVRQAWLVSHPRRRLEVARAMYAQRFPGEDVARLTMQQLRGREGARIRACYREQARLTGVKWEGRHYVPGQPFAAGDDVNRALSAANSCLYGVSHAVVVSLGASPGLGFIHTGGALAFVHDVADLYKSVTAIPVAFEAAAHFTTGESLVRRAMRDKIRDMDLVQTIARDVRALLDADSDTTEDNEAPKLWDEGQGQVAGGRNYAMNDDDAWSF
jgi:CRISPR-associated protein Cas1